MKFLRYVMATMVGITAFLFICFLFLIILVSSSSEDRLVKLEDKTVLHLKLDKPILEREKTDPFSGLEILPGLSEGGIGLIELKDAIRHAATDDKVAGILLETPALMAGYAAIDDLRDELDNFRKSDKFLYSFSELYTEGGYYLASVADSVIINPDHSLFEFNGINLERTYFKRMFEKLGIEVYVFKTSEFKDAFEPFVEEKMNPLSKAHLDRFINTIYDHMMEKVAVSRRLEKAEVNRISDQSLAFSGEDARALGLVDLLAYRDEVDALIRQKTGLGEDDKIPYVSYTKYRKSYKDKNTSKNRVAVIIADGEIINGKGDGGTIGADLYAEEISRLRKDSKVKAIVLRINSPGGGALASDILWREIGLAAGEKPVIASMSDVAASGGYYMAMACDTIVVQPNTITGSIGVTGLFFNLEELMAGKIGLTSDNVKTGEYSDLFSVSRPKTQQELQFFQRMNDQAYKAFLDKASKGRRMSAGQMEPLAGGRVWTGKQAVENGLADVYGNLETAIGLAAEKAGVADDYRVRYYPVQKDPIEELMNRLMGEYEARAARARLGALYDTVEKLQLIRRYEGIQARLPFDLHFGY